MTPSPFALAADSVALVTSDDRGVARQLLHEAIGAGFDLDRQQILDLIDEHADIAYEPVGLVISQGQPLSLIPVA